MAQKKGRQLLIKAKNGSCLQNYRKRILNQEKLNGH